jgi:HAMP domain-containing protein
MMRDQLSGTPAPMRPPQMSDEESGAAPAIFDDAANAPGGLWGMWLRMTLPRLSPAVRRTPSGRDKMRRARVLSALLLTTVILLIVLIPKGFIPVVDDGTLGGVAIGTVIITIAIILCRSGRVTLAGSLFVAGGAAAVAFSLIATPGGLGLQDLPTYDLFAVPIVFAGVLLPRWYTVFVWLGCVAFTIADIILQSHHRNLDNYIQTSGIYATVIIPIGMWGLLAIVSWIAAGSVERALNEADRTGEVERALRQIAEQKKELEDSIAVIQRVHARVANGDLSVRAPIAGGELVPLAISLNLMLERLSRSLAAETALGGLEFNIQRLSEAVTQLARGQIQYPIPQNGMGNLTPVAINLEQLRNGFVQVARTGVQFTERIGGAGQAVIGSSSTVIRQLLQHASPEDQQQTHETLDYLERAAHDLTSLVEQLQRFLARFAA